MRIAAVCHALPRSRLTTADVLDLIRAHSRDRMDAPSLARLTDAVEAFCAAAGTEVRTRPGRRREGGRRRAARLPSGPGRGARRSRRRRPGHLCGGRPRMARAGDGDRDPGRARPGECHRLRHPRCVCQLAARRPRRPWIPHHRRLPLRARRGLRVRPLPGLGGLPLRRRGRVRAPPRRVHHRRGRDGDRPGGGPEPRRLAVRVPYLPRVLRPLHAAARRAWRTSIPARRTIAACRSACSPSPVPWWRRARVGWARCGTRCRSSVRGAHDIGFGHNPSEPACALVARRLGMEDRFFATHRAVRQHRLGGAAPRPESSRARRDGCERGARVLLVVGSAGITVGFGSFTF